MKKGDSFSHSFTVSADVHAAFINLFGDRNPLHTDAAFAQSKGFTSEVMHGNILNGFVSYFIGECLPQKNVIIQTQSIKYAKPVYMNDTLVMHAEITDVFESVNTYEFSYHFTNASGTKVARGTIQIGLLP